MARSFAGAPTSGFVGSVLDLSSTGSGARAEDGDAEEPPTEPDRGREDDILFERFLNIFGRRIFRAGRGESIGDGGLESSRVASGDSLSTIASSGKNLGEGASTRVEEPSEKSEDLGLGTAAERPYRRCEEMDHRDLE